MSKRGLGKGLESLLGSNDSLDGADSNKIKETPPKPIVADLKQSSDERPPESFELRSLPIAYLARGKYQPRQLMDDSSLNELSESIKAKGIIQPIVVRTLSDGFYEIIAGERRWRAAKLAGLFEVPCLVKMVDDESVVAMALIENLQREDLNAIEQAQALGQLHTEFNLTHQKIAQIVGKSRTTVTNILRLNQLHPIVKASVMDKLLDMGHVRALVALENEDEQISMAQHVIKHQFNVRQTEELVKNALLKAQGNKPSNKPKYDQELSNRISKKLSMILDNKVTMRCDETGKGKITITVENTKKLNELITKIESATQSI